MWPRATVSGCACVGAPGRPGLCYVLRLGFFVCLKRNIFKCGFQPHQGSLLPCCARCAPARFPTHPYPTSSAEPWEYERAQDMYCNPLPTTERHRLENSASPAQAAHQPSIVERTPTTPLKTKLFVKMVGTTSVTLKCSNKAGGMDCLLTSPDRR